MENSLLTGKKRENTMVFVEYFTLMVLLEKVTMKMVNIWSILYNLKVLNIKQFYENNLDG